MQRATSARCRPVGGLRAFVFFLNAARALARAILRAYRGRHTRRHHEGHCHISGRPERVRWSALMPPPGGHNPEWVALMLPPEPPPRPPRPPPPPPAA
jgi:hypothetical protein